MATFLHQVVALQRYERANGMRLSLGWWLIAYADDAEEVQGLMGRNEATSEIPAAVCFKGVGSEWILGLRRLDRIMNGMAFD